MNELYDQTVIIALCDSHDLDTLLFSTLLHSRSHGTGIVETSYNMASTNGTFTTGMDDGDARRRIIQTYEKANGSTVHKIEAEDIKKLHKVSLPQAGAAMELF